MIIYAKKKSLKRKSGVEVDVGKEGWRSKPYYVLKVETKVSY